MININISKTLRSATDCFKLNICFATDKQKIVITGASGAGKSTFLNMIAGLIKPDQGIIAFNTHNTLFDSQQNINQPIKKRRTAYLFQNYALFPHLTAAQNIAFGLTPKALFNKKQTKIPQVTYWLQRFQLEHIKNHLPSELSGGQQQRVALARALITEPEILLLDEPFSSLDLCLRTQMQQELYSLQNQLNIPMIMISHDPVEIELFGDKKINIINGVYQNIM